MLNSEPATSSSKVPDLGVLDTLAKDMPTVSRSNEIKQPFDT